MITVFNRKELLITFDMKRQADICEILSSKGIDYAVKTTNLQSSAQLECKGHVRVIMELIKSIPMNIRFMFAKKILIVYQV